MTVLDFPEVIDLMADELARAGIAAIKGDATQGIPAQGFDLVFCGNLFHSMSPAECGRSWRAPPAPWSPAVRWPSSTSCVTRPVRVAVRREHARGDERR